jgi:predicted GIY-YIG superfamily endonuclease
MRELIRKIIHESFLTERIDWTPEKVVNIASKYKTRKEFRTSEPQAYRMAIKFNLFDNDITHLGSLTKRNSPNYWTYDKVNIEAKKYSNRRDFQNGSPKAMAAAKQHGWYHDVTSHMDYLGSLYRRAVYAWEFPDNTVYIGLTDDTARREGEHLDPEGRTAVSKYIKETNTNPTLKIINDYTDVKEAQNIEKCSIDLYKNNGWTVLNKAKAGGLGACKRIWTKDAVEQEAKKYNNRIDFKKGNRSAYVIAVREGWMDDVTKHMSYKQLQWTEELVKNIANKYNNLTEFLKEQPKAAEAARRFGIYNEVVKNMERSKNDTTISKFYSESDIFNELPKYEKISYLRKDNPSLYNFIRKHNYMDKVNDFYKSNRIK